MTMDAPTLSPRRRLRRPAWLASRRRRIAAGVALVLAAGLVFLAVTNPFAAPPRSDATDNSYPTATATVSQQSLASQNHESATLGYAGSYTVAVPTGTSAPAVISARSMSQSGQAQPEAASAREALASAEAAATPTNSSTLVAARRRAQ